jgi:SAM-dependent methyltransferase
MEHDPRDLEWQRRYETNDTPWDQGAAAPPLLAFLRDRTITGRILVPGCGRGHDARALAAGLDTTVVGLDLSETAIAQAKDRSSPAPEPNVSFLAGDFFALPPHFAGSFDWLVEHTCFCAIEPRQRADYVRAAAAALRAGGKIFGIFYLNPERPVGPPFGVTEKELTDLFGPHFTLLEEWVPAESFPGREQRELIRILQKR